jgi:hypothetical protein
MASPPPQPQAQPPQLMPSPPLTPPPPTSPPPTSSPSFASLPAPVWGPTIAIAALVLANLLALLLNPGLVLRSCRDSDRAEEAKEAGPPTPLPSASPPPPPPRRCRLAPVPFFASNVDAEEPRPGGRRQRAPLPRELWGFDVLSPLDPLSSYLMPSSVRPGAAEASAGGQPPPPRHGGALGGEDSWRPAVAVLLPLHVFTFLYFVAYVLAEVLWSKCRVVEP